jgi:hypothetical protein
VAADQPGTITLPLQLFDEIPDVAVQVLFVLFRADPIHAICGVSSDEQPNSVAETPHRSADTDSKTGAAYSLLPSLLLLAVRLALLFRPFLAGQCFLFKLRTSVSPFPL